MDARKSDMMSLVLGGTSDEQGILIPFEFMPADMKFIRYLLEEDLPLGNSPMDTSQALSVSIEMMDELTRGKKYSRKIFLFTDSSACGEIDSRVIEQVKDSEISLFVIDFHESNGMRSPLHELVDAVGGDLLPIKDALGILSHFRSKTVRVTSSFRGSLMIGREIQLPVHLYSKTSERTLPPAKKASSLSLDSALRTFDVERSTVYYTKDEENQSISKEGLAKAYRYGKTLVPFDAVDEAQLKEKTERELSVIGFVSKNEIERHSFMSGSSFLMVDPGQISNASQALSSLIHALYEKDAVAIARYIRCANAQPKLVCLEPLIRADYECLVMNVLPFSEDVRRYTFPPLKSEMSEDQIQKMDAWIDSMDLMTASTDDEGNPSEAFKPKDTFNIAYQRLFQCIQQRLLSEESAIPPWDAELKRHLSHDLNEVQAKALKVLASLYSFEKVQGEALPEARIFAKESENEEISIPNQTSIQVIKERSQ